MKKTLYQKIYSDLVSKIKMGYLKSGDILPSTRELAKRYKCHRFSVMKVCQDLIAENWIESNERSRYRVSSKTPVVSSDKGSQSHFTKDLSLKAKSIERFNLENEHYKIEFWGGRPDLRLFPKDEFRRILSNAIKKAKPEHLNYGLVAGLDSCVKEVSNYLRKSRCLLEKDFIMTNGSQEALFLIVNSFLKPGDKIAIERKGYPPAWRLFESMGALLVPIEVDSEGIDTDDLQIKIKKHNIKMIYVTPLHQYPTTVTLSPRRRQKLIELAETNLIPILEDDYDHEFHYIGPPPAPISAESYVGIYVCSFSKVLFPGARLGVIGCHPNLMRHLCFQKYVVSRQTDSLTQLGLGAWIRDGGFERHLRKTCRIYEKRFEFMQRILKEIQNSYNLQWLTPTGGMSIWVDIGKDSKKFAELAKKEGVFFQHESSMDYLKSKGNHLRIGFASVNEIEIEKGLNILKILLRD